MLNLNDREWKVFSLKEIFTCIKRGKRLKTADHIIGKMPYVSSSAMNNGVDNFVGNDKGARKFSCCLTVANSGSVGEAFFHPYEFVASDHVTSLKSPHLNKYSYIFIITLLERLKGKYSFNREINDDRITREKILLPVDEDNQPDYAFMERYVKERENKILRQYAKNASKTEINEKILPLQDKEWREYQISDIFSISSGKRLTKADMKAGRKPFIGATESNNGITAFVANTNVSEDSNVLGVNYNGSVVENFYHPYTCIFSDDVKRFHTAKIEGNKYLYLFLKTAILQQKCKYDYGYKFNERRMKKQILFLPSDDKGNPDYAYMEQYAKQIFYKIQQRYLKKKGFLS